MEDHQRIERLEHVLGTLIVWLQGTLATSHVQQLMDMLTKEPDA
jgi:hypothetical protein